jgi:hypothetical protein
MRDPNAMAIMGEEGRRVVSEHYSVTVLAPKFAAILRSVAN